MNSKLDNLLDLKETVGNIEASVNMTSAQYDEIPKTVTEHNKEIKILKSRVEEIKKRDETREHSQLKLELHDLKWRSRKL